MSDLLVNLDFMKQPFGGVCRYLQEILRRLPTLNHDLYINTFTTDAPPHRNHNLNGIENTVLHVSRRKWATIFAVAPRIASMYFRIPSHDVLWLPTPITPGPKSRKARIVVTVHDIAPIAHPEFYSRLIRLRWKRLMMAQLALADHYIVPSEFTKREMLRFLRLPEDIISVIPHGSLTVQPNDIRQKKESDVFSSLYVGPLSIKKNTDTLVQAFSVFLTENPNARLIVIGDTLELDTTTSRTIDYLKDRGALVQKPRISEPDLIYCYQQADAVICPSRYEGFGIPLLEAMSFGKPVIASSIPVFREIAGDYVTYFVTEDPESLCEQLRSVVSCIAARELLDMASAHADKFSWDKSAAAHAQLFENL